MYLHIFTTSHFLCYYTAKATCSFKISVKFDLKKRRWGIVDGLASASSTDIHITGKKLKYVGIMMGVDGPVKVLFELFDILSEIDSKFINWD